MDVDSKLQLQKEESIEESIKDVGGKLINEITSGEKQPTEILEIIVKNDLILCFPDKEATKPLPKMTRIPDADEEVLDSDSENSPDTESGYSLSTTAGSSRKDYSETGSIASNAFDDRPRRRIDNRRNAEALQSSDTFNANEIALTVNITIVRPFKAEMAQSMKQNQCEIKISIQDATSSKVNISKKNLLAEWQSRQNAYELYVNDWCKSRKEEFSKIFDEKNFALFLPKKDECEKCVSYRVGQLWEKEFKSHIQRKVEAREEKEKNEKQNGFTTDLQAVLMAPNSKVSTLYYKTKLQVHHFCFYNLVNSDTYCFIWNEYEVGLSSEEFASIWCCTDDDGPSRKKIKLSHDHELKNGEEMANGQKLPDDKEIIDNQELPINQECSDNQKMSNNQEVQDKEM
ncbi:unnamed protein product [Diabrotica balteata]|uniref:Uncharacterized protein n=1 Tax=Diabrotica balteata TaxID=107213 RepID=A0A9N9SUW3_DIABA|nr:unnamed protein product [Diabrotica balteata]